MTQERYRLAKQVNGRGAFADVEIRILSEGPGSRRVAVSENVFAWLKEDYGPNAWEWPVCDQYRQAALDGVNFALDNSSPAVEASILIECIRAAPADSSTETIAYAAAQATWRALKTQPTNALKVNGIELPS